MIKHPIKNRFTNKVQFVAEIDCNEDAPLSIKRGLSVKWAIENKADRLSGADLVGVDLRGVNLKGVDLRYLKSDKYDCYIQKDFLRVYCEHHTWEEWLSFNDESISKMDRGALEWWRIWKPVLLSIRETI
jgi:hypothetical protein